MNKSAAACTFNAELLIETGKATFWTFTFDPGYEEGDMGWDHEEGAKLWDKCLRAMRRKNPDLAGMRVFEPHANGRLHIHAIFNQRVPIRWMKSMARPYGFGRISCTQIQKEEGSGLPDYLAKYMQKGQRDRQRLRKGRRLWATFGKLPQRSLVKNIEIDSLDSRFFRWWLKLSLKEACAFYACVIPSLFGRYHETLPLAAIPKLSTRGQRWHWGQRLLMASQIWKSQNEIAASQRFPGAFA